MDFALSPALLQARDRARTADAEARFDRGLVQELGRRGLLDERDPALARCLIAEELGRVDSSVRGLVTVQVALVAGCLAEWGSPAQRAHWLPRLRSGEAIGCYALTEPEAG